MSTIPELNKLKLPLDDIISATTNFSRENYIGQGGFGAVYKGQLPPSGTVVAVKRLDSNNKSGQGQNEFLKEIVMLARCKHDNLVSLVGFSDERGEKVLVYKHEVNGSLDNHLASRNLTWEQRLRICLGAARGLDYLHSGVGEGHRVIHRDIKSSNILLDANWEAKISDFGLSKVGLKNGQFTFVVTNACGTFSYLDPLYLETGVLTKESDVYSFGVVLFEVLCGRLAMIMEYEDERRFLSGLVERRDRDNNLMQIILPDLQKQMNQKSYEIFTKIALRCLKKDRKQRPTMGLIVRELETALEHQLVSLVTKTDVFKTIYVIDPAKPPGHGSTRFFAQNFLPITRPVHGSTGRVKPGFKTLTKTESPSNLNSSYNANQTHTFNFLIQPSTASTTGPFYDHFDYISRILDQCGIENTTPITPGQWHSPLHPLQPSIFHNLEKHYSSGDTSRRKLVFDLVDEFLVEMLKPYMNLTRPPHSIIMQGSELIRNLCDKIGSFHAFKCDELEDIDVLIDRDIGRSTQCMLLKTVENEVDSIVKDIERDIFKTLVHEMAKLVML